MVKINTESKRQKRINFPKKIKEIVFRYHKILIASSLLVSLYITSQLTLQAYKIQTSSFLNSVNDNRRTTSIFDCEGKDGECKYFYPYLFFSKDRNVGVAMKETFWNKKKQNNYIGLGSRFASLYEKMQNLRPNKNLWIQGPPILLLALDIRDQSFSNTTNTKSKATNNIKVTFIHVHKAGGTTIHFQARKAAKNPELYQIYSWRKRDVSIPKGAPLPQQIKGRLQQYNYQSAMSFLTNAQKFRFNSNERKLDDHLLFAFVRDPLTRFISIIGQVMGAKGSTKTDVSHIMKDRCVKDKEYSLQNSQYIIDCVINYVEHEGFLTDVHFTPQATELAFASQMLPVPIAVFRYEDSYKNVLKAMGLDTEKNLRDGKEDGYRIFPVLTNMTSADLTETHKQRLCKLYEEDIIMLRALDYESSSCDGFL